MIPPICIMSSHLSDTGVRGCNTDKTDCRVFWRKVCASMFVVSKQYVSCLVFQAHSPKITTHLHTTGIHRVGQRTSMKPTLSQTSSKRVCHAIVCPDNRPCCVCSFWGSVWAVLQARVLVACYRISCIDICGVVIYICILLPGR